jgi:predicted GNAT family N-acyltransferase
LKIVEPVTPEDYRKYYDLRWRILCAPWQQSRGIERDPADGTSTHLMAVDDGQAVVGVGRLHFNTPGEAQIRYMAIAKAHQRSGIGSSLLEALEGRAKQLGALQVILNARETALGFYLKHGYETRGPGHILFDSIAHVRMRKSL